MKKKPDLRPEVEQELIRYDALIGKGKEDGEEVEKSVAVPLTPSEAHSMSCVECQKPFSAFRRVKGCFKCNKFFCSDSKCGGKYRSPDLGDGLIVDLCHS